MLTGVARTCYRRQYAANRRKKIIERYGGKCVCCNEREYSFLAIDHVNNDGHKDRYPSGRRISGHVLYTKILRQKFPSTYQVLCHNCNQAKQSLGQCPHKIEDWT